MNEPKTSLVMKRTFASQRRSSISPLQFAGWALVAFGLLIPGTADSALVTFQTGDFSSGWTSHISGTGTAVATTEASGGNPDAFRRLSLTVNPFTSVLDAELWSSAQFTPSIQGTVTSVSFGYDVARVFTSNPGATQITKGIAVRQDGTVYYHFLGVSTASPPNWDSAFVADIVPLFPLIDWANGNTITFGFYDSVSAGSDGFTLDGGYDNFRVDVNYGPVPEPSTYIAGALLFLPFGAHLVRRLRQRA